MSENKNSLLKNPGKKRRRKKKKKKRKSEKVNTQENDQKKQTETSQKNIVSTKEKKSSTSSIPKMIIDTFPFLVGVIPSTLKDEGIEHVKDEDEEDVGNSDDSGSETEETSNVTYFGNFKPKIKYDNLKVDEKPKSLQESLKYPVWIPDSLNDKYEKIGSTNSLHTIIKNIEFSISRSKRSGRIRIKPKKFNLTTELFMNNRKLSYKFGNRKIALLKGIIFSESIPIHNTHLKFRFVTRGPHFDGKRKSVDVKFDKIGARYVFFSLSKSYSFYEYSNGCGIEPVLNSLIHINPKKRFPYIPETDFFEDHGNRKIHKDSFLGKWLKSRRNKMIGTDIVKPFKVIHLITNTPKKNIQRKKKVRFSLHGQKDVKEKPYRKITVDTNYICIDKRHYQKLFYSINSFVQTIPYVLSPYKEISSGVNDNFINIIMCVDDTDLGRTTPKVRRDHKEKGIENYNKTKKVVIPKNKKEEDDDEKSVQLDTNKQSAEDVELNNESQKEEKTEHEKIEKKEKSSHYEYYKYVFRVEFVISISRHKLDEREFPQKILNDDNI